MAADVADELSRVTPAVLRRAEEMCPRRLAHEHGSGRKLSWPGDGPFEVSNRLSADAIQWHQGKVVAEHGFPDPTDLEPEQRALYRAASRAYLAMFGASEVEVADLGWSTDVADFGVRLVGPVGIPVEYANGDRELRVLRVAARVPRVDSVDIRFAILRVHEWAAERVRILAVDLLEDESVEYEIDVARELADAQGWLDERLAVIRARADSQRPRLGRDCRDCPCIPGCSQLKP